MSYVARHIVDSTVTCVHIILLLSLGDGELEVGELMNNIDVINCHSFYGKRLMKEFKKIDTDGDGVIR